MSGRGDVAIGVAAPPRVCVLLTCFNRREHTLACLEALQANAATLTSRLHAVLVDDGSTDGTATAVAARFPWVTVLVGDGALYWCRGMHRAFAAALREGFDAYVWLNDDTVLRPDAIARLMRAEAQLQRRGGGPVIVVGTTVDATTGLVTYGGERRTSRWRLFRVERLQPTEAPQRCDSMTGNIVLVSAAAAARVGNLDPVFEHSMGDTDYALRADRLGVPVWLDAGVHGTCSANDAHGTWVDPTQPLARRWRDMMGRKGLPWRSWLALTHRHAGPAWPLHFVWPYLKVLGAGVLPSSGRSRARRPTVEGALDAAPRASKPEIAR